MLASLLPVAGARAGDNQNITVSPPSIDFDAEFLGGTTPPETVTVENGPTSINLTVSQPTITGAAFLDFAIVNDGCAPYPKQLQFGQSCTLGVEFSPTAVTERNATLNVPSNDPDTPNATVSLTGDGEEAPIVDLLVGKTELSLVGDDVYEPTPITQILNGKIKRGRAKSFVIGVSSDANVAQVAVQGCAGSNGFKVTYERGGTDVTDEVVAGTQETEVASTPDPLDVRVKAKRSAHGTLACTVTGTHEASADDSVQLKLKAKG